MLFGSLVLSSQASNLYTNWFNAVNTFEVANKGSAPVLDVPYDYHVCGTCSSTYVLQVIKTVLTRCVYVCAYTMFPVCLCSLMTYIIDVLLPYSNEHRGVFVCVIDAQIRTNW